ncbi:MAG TPA: alpha/beta hydrolase [Pyrinomonadaceae bacterium]|nr:alpha/beta hydrolase [Pyrinomonadaceae bacterium]
MRNKLIGHIHTRLIACLSLVFIGACVSMAQQPSKVMELDGVSMHAKLDETSVHYMSYGKGDEAIVLIHGWGGNLELWSEHIAHLRRTRDRVLAVDLPGHGKSNIPQTVYSMDYYARAVEAVMREAKVKRAVLVGHSMGTPIARQFYRKYPEKTLGIVIVDGSLRPFGDKKLMDGFLAGFRGPNYKEVGRQMFAGMAGPNLAPQIMTRVQASFLNTPQHVLVSAMEGMADDSIWGLDKINVPVLAVMAKSPFWPPDTEQFYRSIAPKLDFVMWEGVGHFLQMEKPVQFDDAVIAFLDKHKLLKKS